MQGGQSSLKTQLLERAFHEQLLVIADTTRFVMAGLYALYKTEIQKSEMIQNPGSEAFVEKWRDNPSPYLAHFAQELRPPSTTSGISIWHFILLVAGLGLGAAVTAFWLGKRTIPAAESSLADNLSLLSIQERKVHQMLAKGMSNKEISLELNIGVNTVKSHVSSILGKLKAKSRKELME
ncbi:hypothetical protein GC194_05845 [bacterium]|nr:hypothetical protein [bacterium]